ncbi:hypothetical protein D8674_033009 [Pyrus ussuriensis x Pyrus communis]|uniref:Uncharacterized protein n=1 Tax=Pyrus ussuriensis x Pyrus communis TaxID=2448454 RepID=A0A5N5HXY0_9ROSA|nr:hypothetical protein D8674_033009 [Pyrus ussuriensis x Pyrus communis]
MLHISGSLLPSDTGSIPRLDKDTEDRRFTRGQRSESEAEVVMQEPGAEDAKAFSIALVTDMVITYAKQVTCSLELWMRDDIPDFVSEEPVNILV